MREKKLKRVETSNFSLDVFQVYRPDFSLPEFEQLMRSYGFVDEWDMELLVTRYFYRMSLRQIEREMSYVSYQTVKRRLKKIHDLLVERGFKPRSRK